MVEIFLDYEWIVFMNNPENKEFEFNNNVKIHRKNNNFSAIYKWSVLKNGIEEYYYIGETNSFANRIHFYLNPEKSQKTNIEINAKFKDFLKEGYQIKLMTLKINKWSFDNKNLINLDESFFRKLIENILIIDSQQQNNNSCLNKNGRNKKELINNPQVS